MDCGKLYAFLSHPSRSTGSSPGDDILPLHNLLRDLKLIGYKGPLSLALFNREHWKQDPLVVAKTGLRKMRQLITEAGV